jgi:hypothetical protein
VTKKIKKEASTVGGGATKGFLGPFGARAKKRTKKRKPNPSKPFGEAAMFESCLAAALLESDDIGEIVRKRGNSWVFYDDETGAEKGSWQDRETAWKFQRSDRRAKTARKKTKGAEAKRQKQALTPTVAKKAAKMDKAKKAPEPKKAEKPKVEKPKLKPKVRRVESIFTDLLKPLKEGSIVSYVFENTPLSDESVTWENFVSKLSKETVMSDPKLKRILQDMQKKEAKLLESAVDQVGDVLKKTGTLEIVDKKAEIDPTTKEVKINFVVDMKENKTKLNFAVKMENGRPLILFPDDTRNMLNTMANNESKQLRAELIHAQETILNNMEEVVLVTQKRDKYLKTLEKKVDKFINSVGPLEISMLRHLLKMKYKGVR